MRAAFRVRNGRFIHRRDVSSRFTCALLVLLILPLAVSHAAPRPPIKASIYSAAPAPLGTPIRIYPRATREGDDIVLANDFFTAHLSARTATITAIENHVTRQKHVLTGDAVGVNDFLTSADNPREFRIQVQSGGGKAHAIFEDDAAIAGCTVRITYSLVMPDFWLERRITVVPRDPKAVQTIDRLTYGRLQIEGGERKELVLGKFDRPCIAKSKDGKGGLFAGVAHWFYRVADDGTYVNTDMKWSQTGEFVAEPWYVGVFATEAGEPYPGWLWYREYVQRTKMAAAKHDAWFSWNAGWGQWGVDIDDPVAPKYLELMSRLGITGVIFGSGGFGKGIDKFNELAATDATTKSNIETLKRLNIAGGTLNNGAKPWDDAEKFPALLDELNRHAAAGFRSTAFDFFESKDTYAAHRRVAEYFRAAREKLDYTECHLGMAAYGPQFQRMVRVNHPDDIHGFDISHFSADWTTFLAFRHSRRNWQRKYEYLMPEDGLYYYLTHYSNWGNPRRYSDPEPQQFVWSVSAYCGIGFNFHDTFGWRESVAAASAFTTAPVFGHIDLKMPARDEEFATEFFAWMKENAALLRPSRVCAETDDHCIVSKIRSGKGLIYVLKYSPGEAKFDLTLDTGHAGKLSIRLVYPAVEEPRDMNDGDVLSVTARGESTTIFEVNRALASLPPQSRSSFPIELSVVDGKSQFTMPDVREALEHADDAALPTRLLSLDQVQDSRPDLLVNIPTDKDGVKNIPVVKWLGKGKLPDEFRTVYDFDDADTVETWKIVPWAFADRVWLVVRPDKPLPLTGDQPAATINGTKVPLVPRVDHRFDNVDQWRCPLYHADVTKAVRFGESNDVNIIIPGQSEPPFAYITTAADRATKS